MTEKLFDASDSVLQDVLSFVEEKLDEIHCPRKISMQIIVAVEEVFVNISHYAYIDGKGKMKLGISTNNGAVTLCFIDSGVPFNPLTKTDPDITLLAEERDIGGLGILMVKRTMDELNYENKDGKNVLTLVKKYE